MSDQQSCYVCQRKKTTCPEHGPDETMMTRLVQDHPFPSYKDMMNKMLQIKELFVMCSEYGEANHERVKAMYESSIDKDTCIKAGKAINKAGGLTAMQACYYILFHFIRGFPAYCPEACYKVREVQSYWDGIGEWEH